MSEIATVAGQGQSGPDMVRWSSAGAVEHAADGLPPMLAMMKRGLLCTCPVCGTTKLFNGFLRVSRQCGQCGTELGKMRADDAPPYFTILLTGHVVVPLLFLTDRAYAPPVWVLSAIFLPLTAAVAMALIRPIKGATLGAMLKLGLGTHDDATPDA